MTRFDDFNRPRSDNKTRHARKRILVVTEGAVTEPEYFEAIKIQFELRKNQLDVQIEKSTSHDGNMPTQIVSSAIRLRDEAASRQEEQDKLDNLESRESYDAVWVVFDTEREDGRRIDLKPAAEHANKNQIGVAISRPSFECWFLLHLRDGLSSGMATCDDVCKAISKETVLQFGRKYSKTSKNNADLKWIIAQIMPSTGTAIQRAHRHEAVAFMSHTLVPDNPGTKVHKLVSELWNSSKMGGKSPII